MFKNTSAGVSDSRVFPGRLFNLLIASSISSVVTEDRSPGFGNYGLISPFVFSFRPLLLAGIDLGQMNIGLEFLSQLLVLSKFCSMVQGNGLDTVLVRLYAISKQVFDMLSCLIMPNRPQ